MIFPKSGYVVERSSYAPIGEVMRSPYVKLSEVTNT
jgi:hypothetical protein